MSLSTTLAPTATTQSGTDEEEAAFVVIQIALGFLAAIVLAFIAAKHLGMFYQDLYTGERASVSHRRNLPEITPEYRWAAYLTSSLVFTAAIFQFVNVLGNFPDSYYYCIWTVNVGTIGLFNVRWHTYMIFTVRLYLVYSGSPFEINPKKLIFWAALLTIYCWGFSIYSAISFAYEGNNGFAQDSGNDGFDIRYETEDQDDVSINLASCETNLPDWYFIIFFFVDLFAIFGYFWAFANPIRKIIKSIKNSSRNLDVKSKLTQKILVMGLKMAILTLVLFLSIQITIFVYLATELELFAIDLVINVICLVLMTQYYPDKIYFHRLCLCCVYCCDRNGYIKKRYYAEEVDSLSPRNGDDKDGHGNRNNEQSRAETQTMTATAADQSSDVVDSVPSGPQNTKTISANARSLDTNSAVRVAAQETLIDGKGKASPLNEQELALNMPQRNDE